VSLRDNVYKSSCIRHVEESKHLLVRLLMRKHKWLRKSKLDYAKNIRDLDQTTADLVARGLLEAEIDDMAEAVKILSKDELKTIAKDRRMDITIENPVSTAKSHTKPLY
jgi:Fanconi-associated nuclease 1